MGNLRSVQKALEKVGFTASIIQRPEEVADADGLVLPGVGAFGDAMANLRAGGMDKAICRYIAAGRPFLGICLGLQVLFESSEEFGESTGLGVFSGRVRRLPPGLKVPHMGWNQVDIRRPNPLLQGIPNGAAFYFVHSYYVDPGDNAIIATTTDYGLPFTSMVRWDNIYGIQFHPEKSSSLGLQILRNFGEVAVSARHSGH